MCLQHYCTCEVHVHMSYIITCLITLHRAHLPTINKKPLIPFHQPRPIHLPDPHEEPENTQSCLTRQKAKRFKARQETQTQERVETNRRPQFGTQTRSRKRTPKPRPKEGPLSVTTWRLLIRGSKCSLTNAVPKTVTIFWAQFLSNKGEARQLGLTLS